MLCAHLGRPKGKVDPAQSLRPVVDALAKLLGAPVKFVEDCVGEKAEKAAAELKDDVAAAPGLRLYSGDDANPAATMRAGGAGVISGRSSAYPEVYAALSAGDFGVPGVPGVPGPAQLLLDRIVALGASTGRLKYALQLRGLGGGIARMTVDPPDEPTAAAIAAIMAEF